MRARRRGEAPWWRRGCLQGLPQLRAQQEPKSGERGDGRAQAELRKRPLPGQQLRAVDERHHGLRLRGTDVGQDPRAILEGTRGPGKQLQLDVDDMRGTCRFQRPCRDERRTARRVGDLDGGEVRGGSLSCLRARHRLPMHLHAADAHAARFRATADDVHFVPGLQRTGEERSGDDRAEPFHREGTVEGKKERSLVGARRVEPGADRAGDRADQLGQSLPGTGGALHHGRVLQEGSGDQLLQLEQQELAVIGPQRRQQIRLGERDDARANAQQPEHVEVLGRLWHRAFVRGNAKDRDIHAERRADHRAQEPLVAGNVDHTRGTDPGQLQVRVACLQRDPAPLLLWKAIGVDSRERLHQRRLAVIDVPGGADHDSQRPVHSSTQAMPAARRARSRWSCPCMIATGAAQ